MRRRVNRTQHHTSNTDLNDDTAHHVLSPSLNMNSYNPITVINNELNSEECRRLLRKVDKMREILQLEKIALPQIVVVGDQSVGKSSILEAISGIELPRAQNVCTRCQLELRLKRTPPETVDHATIRCAEVDELIIHDFTEIASRIIDFTNHLTGNAVAISSSPIFLTVYKQDIQDDLTLIDLPGQSPTIYRDIVSLIEACVQPESAIILHVIPSSVDFTTSESIKICQRYDPSYERQIIAVSKIDKHDKGIAEKLQGITPGSISLSLGCVAVLNRRQEEIEAKVSFQEMRRREEEFFATNPAFANVPSEYLGSQQLVKKLVKIQQERIKATLPAVIEEVKKKLQDRQDELRQLPASITTEAEARNAFNEILHKYRKAVEQCTKGEYEMKIETPAEKFDPHTYQKWDDRIAYHLKMIEK